MMLVWMVPGSRQMIPGLLEKSRVPGMVMWIWTTSGTRRMISGLLVKRPRLVMIVWM